MKKDKLKKKVVFVKNKKIKIIKNSDLKKLSNDKSLIASRLCLHKSKR